MAVVLSAATVVAYLLLRVHGFGPALWRSGDVYASLPLGVEVWRLPMSLFLPTPYLPVWGAGAQVLVVIGLGELLLGRWLTLVVAALGHVGATLTTRMVLEFGQGSVFALPPALAHALDSGPSAAVTAVGACVLIGMRLNRMASILCVTLVVAAVVAPGIDGQEHLVALACGVMAGVVHRQLRPVEQSTGAPIRRRYLVGR